MAATDMPPDEIELESAAGSADDSFTEAEPDPKATMAPFRRNAIFAFQLLTCITVLVLFSIFKVVSGPLPGHHGMPHSPLSRIQYQHWQGQGGQEDSAKAARVKAAMKYTFWKYKTHAWGHDEIKPLTGDFHDSRNGWAATIVDSSTTIALMGLWEEFQLEIDHIINSIDFTYSEDLVDPFETTIRYLGGLVSLVDLFDAGIVPDNILAEQSRDKLLDQAITLGNKLAPAFTTPSGMVWTRVNFTSNIGHGDSPSVYPEDPTKPVRDHQTIGLARAGSNILENRVLTRLSGNPQYFRNASNAWAPLVWNKYIEALPGLVDGPIDVITGEPVGAERMWDSNHDSYYEYLIKAAILSPRDKYANDYTKRWVEAALALQDFLVSRTTPTANHSTQHLFMGKYSGWNYNNKMSHLACFAPGSLMLGGRYLKRESLVVLGQALLEACHHSYTSTTTRIGPESLSWVPKDEPHRSNSTYSPNGERSLNESETLGFWTQDARYRLRPEYVESLFYGYRITGEERYRDWAWEAFRAIEKHCTTDYGFAGIWDVMASPEEIKLIDEAESFWSAETLKYFYLTFTDVEVANLDYWVFTTEGHPLRMIR